ncbi:hypothetical protein HUJ05_006744 [Dendroctonus ponderosae]|nr:hypothetical protein HUJ05_006744 [Dendroctonus ponderosae]
MAHSINGDTVSECSEASTLIDGSVISTVPDRHGFLGIPMSIRPRAWLYICGGHQLMTHNPGRYEECLRAPGEAKSLEDIKKDIHRQFPTHEMFNSEDKPGQHELLNVLKAYTVNNPEIGYCQAQAPVAAFLLMHMPAEQAFWCLVSISNKYLQDYYSPDMEVVQRDGSSKEGISPSLSASQKS